MIVVDSSVWIDHLRQSLTAHVQTLRELFRSDVLLIGDLVMLEVLQGAQDEAHFDRLVEDIRHFQIVEMLDEPTAIAAARNYRALRRQGVSIRKTVGLVIGTYCILNGHTLLHDDRDFEPMRLHLGLQVM